MTYFLRPWNGQGFDGTRIAPNEYGQRRDLDGSFVASYPLVMHDHCADQHGCGGHPWDAGREAFGRAAGQDLCWAPIYGGEYPCYWCGETAD
jgi:hypothetical protein